MNEEQNNHLPDVAPANDPSNGEPHDELLLITAYALGELNEAERAEVEVRLGASPEDRRAIEELSRLGKLLRKVYEQAPLPERTPGLRETVLAELARPTVEAPLRLPKRFPRHRFWLPLSVAASLAIVCGTLIALTKTKHDERAVAQYDAIRVASGEADRVSDLADTTEEFDVLQETESQPAASNLDLYAEQSGSNNKGASLSTLSGEDVIEAPVSLEPESAFQLGRRGGYFGGGMSADGASQGVATGLTGKPGTSALSKSREDQNGGGPALGENSDKYGVADLGRGDQTAGGMPAGAQSFGLGAMGGGQRGNQSAGGMSAGAQPSDRRGGASSFRYRGRFGESEQDEGKKRDNEARFMDGGLNHNGAFDATGRDFGSLSESQVKGAGEPVSGGGSGGAESGASSSARSRPRVYTWNAKSQDGDAQGSEQGEQNGGGKGGGGQAKGAGEQRGSEAYFSKNELGWHRGEVETSPSSGFGVQNGTAYFYVPNTESYAPLVENPFRKPTEHPLSTFSVDVDTASYTNVRRFLSSRALPPPDAVRVEELINYFQYSYPQPEGNVPFSITTDMADCPWNAEHRLLRVGLKGRDVPADQRPASNLVFLLDVSGSMDAPNKLPLVKEAMYLLTDKLTENDRVAIVVYAGNSGLVLPPTNGTNKAAIRNAIAQLVASGSTNGGQGLQMAYDTAQSQFVKGGTNRVILATDGDFNVGIVDQNDLVRLIEEKAKGGVFLSALGFGVGNLKDGTLEKLADKGNGNYAYIDTLGEARRVLVEQLSGTLVAIAKDVKLQIEFNPAQAAEYRLIGYEDRVMPHQDFHDDRKDAGEIGAGHTVTALYEIVPAARAAGPGGERLKYQRSESLTAAADSNELATIKLRYKEPEANESRLIEQVITDRRPQQAVASSDFNFAAAVAEFGMLLRESPYRGAATYKAALALAEQGLSNDANGYRSEFIELVRQARDISGKE